jgi:hypothetical protein
MNTGEKNLLAQVQSAARLPRTVRKLGGNPGGTCAPAAKMAPSQSGTSIVRGLKSGCFDTGDPSLADAGAYGGRSENNIANAGRIEVQGCAQEWPPPPPSSIPCCCRGSSGRGRPCRLWISVCEEAGGRDAGGNFFPWPQLRSHLHGMISKIKDMPNGQLCKVKWQHCQTSRADVHCRPPRRRARRS